MSHIENIFLPDFKLQIVRLVPSAKYSRKTFWHHVELHKFYKATFSTPKHSNMTYVLNEYYDGLMIEAESNGHNRIPYKWIEKGTSGHMDGKTGRHILTEANMFRTTLVADKLLQDSFLPQITLQPHIADMKSGEEMAQWYKYDKFGSALYLSGSFRGSFISQRTFEDHSVFTIIVISHLDDEPLFRTREFVIKVDGADVRTVMDNIDSGNIELLDCYDGFASFGAEYGRIWHNVSVSSHTHLDNFSWMTKGRRCIQFDRKQVNGDDQIAETFQLTRYPAQIELYLNLLYACQ